MNIVPDAWKPAVEGNEKEDPHGHRSRYGFFGSDASSIKCSKKLGFPFAPSKFSSRRTSARNKWCINLRRLLIGFHGVRARPNRLHKKPPLLSEGIPATQNIALLSRTLWLGLWLESRSSPHEAVSQELSLRCDPPAEVEVAEL